MNRRKLTHLTIIAVMGVFMITNYQNCAPAPQGVAEQYEDGSVRVINPVVTSNIVSFADKSVSVDPTAVSVVLDGTCREDQIGGSLRWELRDSQNAALADGTVECTVDGFQVEVAPMQDLDCESTYAVVAQFGVSESEAVRINRRCQ